MQNRSLEQIKTAMIVKTQSKQFQQALNVYRKRLSDLNLSIPDGGFKTRKAFSLWVERYSKKHHSIRSSSSFQEKVNEITQGKASFDQWAYDRLERLYREEGLDEDWFAPLADAMRLPSVDLDPWNDEHRSFVENLFFFGKADKNFGLWQVRVRVDKQTKKPQLLARLYSYTTRDWFSKYWPQIRKQKRDVFNMVDKKVQPVDSDLELRFYKNSRFGSDELWLEVRSLTKKKEILEYWPTIKREIENCFGSAPRNRKRVKLSRDLYLLENSTNLETVFRRSVASSELTAHELMRNKLFAKNKNHPSTEKSRSNTFKRAAIEQRVKIETAKKAKNRLLRLGRKGTG